LHNCYFYLDNKCRFLFVVLLTNYTDNTDFFHPLEGLRKAWAIVFCITMKQELALFACSALQENGKAATAAIAQPLSSWNVV
jgi:hypothetical protein